MSHQDWKPVKFERKRTPPAPTTRPPTDKLDNYTGEGAPTKKINKYGNELIKIRTKNKLSQKQLAQKLNIKSATLIEWEKNIKPVPSYIKNKIIKLYK